MRLHIAAVGKLKSGPENMLFERYSERISHSGKPLHMFGPSLIEITEAKGASREERTGREAQQLFTKIPDAATLVLLDEKGKDLSSVDLSTYLRDEQNAGTSDLVFVIGGADGHGESMKKRARRAVRFGTQTWPHQLVRVMLAEQLYRAITILSGHPYHRS